MATSVVLPTDLRFREWHDTRDTSRPCSTIRDSSNLSMGSMAQSPVGAEPSRDTFPHKPQLPSFSNFLSGAGRADLQFSLGGPGPNRGDHGLINNIPLGHHATQPQPPGHGPSDQNRAHPFDTVSLPRGGGGGGYPDSNPGSFWPSLTSSPVDRHATLPRLLALGPAPDRAHGRVLVREENIPGKGLCYIYDDGSVCPKAINGDTVNPKWGTTKAGKPRKRLGQACNTCREKKIKCDPNVPKCAQCQKFGRECKFDSTPRASSKQSGSVPSTYSSSYSSSAEQMLEKLPPRRGSTASTEITAQDLSYSKDGPPSSILSPETQMPPASEDTMGNEDGKDDRPLPKKPRFSASPRPISEGWPSDSMGTESVSGSIASPPATRHFSWQTDPYELDRDMTLYYINKYFANSDSVANCMLPKRAFIRWVKSTYSKSLADKMLLYAILAMGTAFSRRPGWETHRPLFLDIVHEAVLKSADQFSLQLIQTRLILALLAFSQGQYTRAWDFCGAALRTAFGMRFNTEEGVSAGKDDQELDFGFDFSTLVECRRRTFWATYIMDRFNGCCLASAPAVYRSECRIRLPCTQEAYEKGEDIPVTAFDLETTHSKASAENDRLHEEVSQVGLLGYLVQIATIFNDVMDRMSRNMSLALIKYDQAHEMFYHDTMHRLHSWDKLLRKHLHTSGDGGDRRSEPVGGLHILYHYTAMLLHRYVRHAEIGPHPIRVHVTGAYEHARLMLEIVQRLSNDEEKNTPFFRFATTNPFSGFAITAALDVITAAGTLSDLMDNKSPMLSLISSGLEALEGLVDYWHSARQQRDMIKDRFGALLSATKRASDFNGAFYFGKPMQSPCGLEQDIVYGLPRMRYFQALGWEDRIHNEGDFHRLDDIDNNTDSSNTTKDREQERDGDRDTERDKWPSAPVKIES
ncbi:uncharacterized protein Z518_00164 [Rhinocladiella mackenziei CBS 650.93]|uniref:Rhinocladiella mackenziei CBS 650.93 unplaced genomic scaffold supercont1.1, whole genome shotgun sequence n=1 Tax=Rhinocladiella mackenziei CBS 650.93 TaxID=1442369 RepID=A0A0D2J0C8_9EURO|nr:uncharacterized protein Z518_00164 [Rhinocladiella mackenziei CBS 650.93]KIX09086.1 hypothetical protein Z518_00164 [Rhinocladiella mackenziei CBS 650.93]